MDKEKTDLDPGWLPEVEELHLRETLASQMGGAENLARHRAAGRLNVRERIDRLLDKGSFHETGGITGVPTYEGDRLVKLFPSNFVMGSGKNQWPPGGGRGGRFHHSRRGGRCGHRAEGPLCRTNGPGTPSAHDPSGRRDRRRRER